MTEPDDPTREAAMRRAFELAREATDHGDGPYGTVLVVDDEVVMAERNETTSENDLRRHPELTIAKRVAAELDPDTAAEAVMVTSTEPCSMCAKGIADTNIREVVYSVSIARNYEITGVDYAGIPAAEVFERYGAETAVTGPVLPEEGEALLREADGTSG